MLEPAVRDKLGVLTIVGMKYYNGAHERIRVASQLSKDAQLLFLVADVHNKYDVNAVALHDGTQKLGHVCAAEAVKVKQVLKQLAPDDKDVVLIAHVAKALPKSFDWTASFKLEVIGFINERVARKYAQAIKAQEAQNGV